jgi:hypothetical protein
MPYSAHPKPAFIHTVAICCLQFLLFAPLHAQNDCATKIQEAQKYYDQGMIDEIPGMLAPCMQAGFTRTQKIEAYKLIILSYLFDENQFEAEKTMLEFLKKYPEYEIMPNDPVEFVYLFESYRTASIFSVGFTGGLNFTDPRIIEPFSTFDLDKATLKNTMRPGFQVAVGLERYISKKFMVNVEAILAMNKYQFTDEITNNHNSSSVTYDEKLMKIELPITMTYEFTISKTHFIARAGMSAAKITKVTGQPSRKFYQDSQTITGSDQNISDYRKKFLYSGILGAGVRYKVPRGILSVDLRAELGLTNIVVSSKRYENHALYDRFYYLDDDFSLNSISLSVGYYFSFYSPRKQR